MFLLDTNVVAELRKPRPHGAVRAWILGLPDPALFLCGVTLGEIQAGIELIRSQDQPKADALEVWLDRVAAAYNMLPIDGVILREWARLMHRQSDTA